MYIHTSINNETLEPTINFSSLVKDQSLRDALSRLYFKASTANYRLVIPIDEDNISRYWSLLGIADCTFPYADELVIRILVPIRKLDLDLAPYLLTSLPFRRLYNGEAYICLVSDFEDEKQLIFDRTGGVTYQPGVLCDVTKDSLCYVEMGNPSFRNFRFVNYYY